MHAYTFDAVQKVDKMQVKIVTCIQFISLNKVTTVNEDINNNQLLGQLYKYPPSKLICKNIIQTFNGYSMHDL